MLDVRTIVERRQELEEALKFRMDTALLGQVQALDERRRALMADLQSLQQRQNQANNEIKNAFKVGKGPEVQAKVSAMREGLKELSTLIKEREPMVKEAEDALNDLLLRIPNIPLPEVPQGKSEEDNQVVKVVGVPRDMGFTPRDHVDLGEHLGIIDFGRAAKLSGARFALYKSMASRLKLGLVRFMLDQHTRRGYTEILTPFLVSGGTMLATGQLPKFEEDLFKTSGEKELYLIPTAEVPLVGMHADEIFREEDLPLHYCGFTPCFRSEAGSYGKDVRGMIRMHQFLKVELVKFCRPQDSEAEHQAMVADAEHILQTLDLPYRVMLLSSGDMGFNACKCYDLEVWVPSQNRYREISSVSNVGDFQARRARIRYKDSQGKNLLVHTLNGSGLAVGRTLVAILENYQQADGSVVVPEALRPYVGGVERITPPSRA